MGGIRGHASQPAIYTVIWTSALTAILAVALRLYTRFKIVRKPDWDDLLSTFALLFTIIFTVFVTLQTHYGLGRHLHTLSHKEETTSLLCLFLAIIAYQISLGLAKLSIVAQCLRVFGSIRKFQITCWVLAAFLVVYILYTVLITVFLCSPPAFFWNLDIRDGKCLPRIPIWFLNSALGITTDIAVAILPIPVVRTMRLPRRQKNMLMIVFLLGGAVCIVSIIRFYSLYAVSSSADYTYDDAQTAIYSSIEASFSIVFGCVPSWNAFFGKYCPRLYYGANADQQGAVGQGVVGELNEVSNRTIALTLRSEGDKSASTNCGMPNMAVLVV